MLQLGKMQVETALFFESVEQIYERVFRTIKPRTSVPAIAVQFRKYANANSRIRLEGSSLRVDISDVLECAPAPIQEALAYILIGKLFRKVPDTGIVARYRRYISSIDVRKNLQAVKRERGRKLILHPQGDVYDLRQIFEDLNCKYFFGMMAQPHLGWSVRTSRTTLGHYDPSHHTIVLTNLLDSVKAPELIVRYVMFHEMLHLRYPTEQKQLRRCVHTRDFKAAEKQFENYSEAKRALKDFVEGRR